MRPNRLGKIICCTSGAEPSRRWLGMVGMIALAFLGQSTQASATSPFEVDADADALLSAWVPQVPASPKERADALYQALLRQLDAGAWVADKVNEPKERPPKTAADLIRLASTNGVSVSKEERAVGCLELSFVFVALARHMGLDALGAMGPHSTGTGQIGHVMGAVRLSHSASDIVVYDLQNRRSGGSIPHVLLNDAQFEAHHFNHLAVSAYLAGALDKAREWLDAGIELDPDSPMLRANRAVTLGALGEVHLALVESRWAVELAPHIPIYQYHLGHFFLRDAAPQEASALLRDVVRREPSYGLAWRDLGWAYLLMGRDGEATEALRKAAVARTPAPDAHLYLALAQLTLGDKHAAQATVEKATREGTMSAANARSVRALIDNRQRPEEPFVGLMDEVRRLRRNP